MKTRYYNAKLAAGGRGLVATLGAVALVGGFAASVASIAQAEPEIPLHPATAAESDQSSIPDVSAGPMASVELELVTDRSELSGYNPGDNVPDDGAAPAQTRVVYRARLDFAPGPARTVNVEVLLPNYLVWDGPDLQVDQFCQPTDLVSAERLWEVVADVPADPLEQLEPVEPVQPPNPEESLNPADPLNSEEPVSPEHLLYPLEAADPFELDDAEVASDPLDSQELADLLDLLEPSEPDESLQPEEPREKPVLRRLTNICQFVVPDGVGDAWETDLVLRLIDPASTLDLDQFLQVIVTLVANFDPEPGSEPEPAPSIAIVPEVFAKTQLSVPISISTDPDAASVLLLAPNEVVTRYTVTNNGNVAVQLGSLVATVQTTDGAGQATVSTAPLPYLCTEDWQMCVEAPADQVLEPGESLFFWSAAPSAPATSGG